MGRLLGSAAMAAVLAAGLAGVPTGASGLTGRGTPARTVAVGQVGSVSAAGPVGVAGGGAAAAGPVRPVLLIDGARLLAGRTAGGGYSHNPMAGTAAGLGAALVTLTLGAKTYVVPLDALPYLGRGLSPSLFDIGSLLGERGGRLAVQISYAGHLPTLPGVTVTSASGGSASGYLTEASAQRFGAALARQYAADHDRASYGQDGLFANQVSISLPGAAAARRPTARQTAARPDGARPGAAGPGAAGPGVRHFPMQTLTMTATNLAGRPDTGDSVEVLNADDVTKFDDPLESNNVFYRGVAKFSVPPGHYWALGSFSPPAKPGQPFSVRMVVLPQFTVRGSTTVHMNERAASSPVQEVTPRPAQSSYTFFVLIRLGAARVPGIMGLLAFIPGAHMWVSPTSQRPTVGGLQSFTATELDSPPGTPGTPYAYGLAYLDTSGLVPAQRHIVNPATLAHVHARYYQAVPARVQHFMTVGTTLINRFVGRPAAASSSAHPARSTNTCRPITPSSGPTTTSSRPPCSPAAAGRWTSAGPSPLASG